MVSSGPEAGVPETLPAETAGRQMARLGAGGRRRDAEHHLGLQPAPAGRQAAAPRPKMTSLFFRSKKAMK